MKLDIPHRTSIQQEVRMLEVEWVTCTYDGSEELIWCGFENVNLKNVDTIGVYIIWYEGEKPASVRIGQGDIAARIAAHRNDPEITQYKEKELLVTWAAVQQASIDGVERWLADWWPPLVGEAFPDVVSIEVNPPF